MTGADEDCSLGGADFTDKSNHRVGHLNTILAREGGNLNNPIFKSSNVLGLPGEGMLKFRLDRYIREGIELIWSSQFFIAVEQQRERPEKFKSEQEFKPWPLQCRCSAPPVELSGQLGTGPYVGRHKCRIPCHLFACHWIRILDFHVMS